MFGPRHTLKSVLQELEKGLRDGTIVLDTEETDGPPAIQIHNHEQQPISVDDGSRRDQEPLKEQACSISEGTGEIPPCSSPQNSGEKKGLFRRLFEPITATLAMIFPYLRQKKSPVDGA